MLYSPPSNTIQSDNLYEYHSQLSIDSAQPAHDFDVYDLEEFSPRRNKPFWATPWDIVVGQGYALVDNFMQQHEIRVEKGTFISINHGPIQRMKYLIAMVGLIAIACIFFLGQISKEVTLPPLTNDMVTVIAPQANSSSNIVASPIKSGQISPIFSPQVQRWEPLIVSYANQFGLDPNAVATVMQIESCGDPYAQSHAGAQGLFQVMPFHFEAHEDMLDPATNANRGVAYLALGLDITNGDMGRAMAGYNGGHSIANKDSSHWHNETQRYYYWGTGIYADAVAGNSSSERLQEWLQAGGASLCSQADSRDISVYGY